MDHPRRRSIALGSGLVVLVAGALVSNVAMAAWGIAVSAMAAASMLWAREGWRGVDISVRFYPERVFISERTEVRVHVTNTKRLPVPFMFEQPERFAGVRPYEAGDPLSRIHWKLTGHSGILQTKLFEPARSADVVLALDLAVGEPFWDSIYPEIAEDTIGWASFVGRQ